MGSRDLRPLATALATAVVSTGLLAVALWQGWLGPDVGRGANFCEAARDGWVAQPANTLSNLGFVLAGLAVAWHAGRPGAVGVMPRPLATAYAAIVVLLGPASAAMHATQSAWGGHLDLLSMYLIASFAAAYAVTRWVRRGSGTFAVTYVGCLALCEAAGLYRDPVPVVQIAGNLVFGSLLVVAVLFETLLWRRARAAAGAGEPHTVRDFGFGVAAFGSLLTAFVIWNLGQHPAEDPVWCDPHSLLQAHAAWHLLCALAAYFLYRLYASERLSP